MAATHTLSAGVLGGLDLVAETLVAALSRVVTRHRTVRVTEGERGQFSLEGRAVSSPEAALWLADGKLVGQAGEAQTALRGCRVEAVLRSDRFVFKPLELPARAADFLDGVVRAQIDRLTPWSAEHAVFGCSAPADAGPGRISVTVAATARSMVADDLDAFSGSGARSLKISTRPPEAAPDAPTIPVIDRDFAALSVRQARGLLLTVLAGACLLAAGAAVASAIITSNFQAQRSEIAKRIDQRRQALIATRNSPGDPKTMAEQALARRKNETPSGVVILEVLSRILPDHTYVTEMRVEGNKLRLMGVTHDAPALIGLLERSAHFSDVTFFAPTTRGQTDPGDRFNIEARIEPVFDVRQ